MTKVIMADDGSQYVQKTLSFLDAMVAEEEKHDSTLYFTIQRQVDTPVFIVNSTSPCRDLRREWKNQGRKLNKQHYKTLR